jgi:hypothetical protein
MEGPHREHPLMALPPGLGEGLACALLWLGWSLLVGAAANQLPLRWLANPAAERSQGEAATALRRYERCWLIRRWKPWIPDAGHVLPGGIRKASLMGRDRAGLERLLRIQESFNQAKAPGGLVGKLKQLGLAAAGAATFLRLYLLPVKHHALPAQVRMAPAW